LYFIGACHNRASDDDARWARDNHNDEEIRNDSATKEAAWTGYYYASLASFAFTS
jgi:hypothetical protein